MSDHHMTAEFISGVAYQYQDAIVYSFEAKLVSIWQGATLGDFSWFAARCMLIGFSWALDAIGARAYSEDVMFLQAIARKRELAS